MKDYAKDAIAELEAGNVYVGEFGQEIIERAIRAAVEEQKACQECGADLCCPNCVQFI